MQFLVLAAALVSTVVAQANPNPEACAQACTNTYNACKDAPGANQAWCSQQYITCLGYSPFTGANGAWVQPTACSGSGNGAYITSNGYYPTSTTCATLGYAVSTYPVVAGGANLAPAYAAMALGVAALL